MNTKRRAGSGTRLAILGVALVLFFSTAVAREDPKKHYALIFGTVYGADDRPVYGVRVTIHPAGKKRPSWELVSDHHGEFAQRVPPGPQDYEIVGVAEMARIEDGKAQPSKKKRFKVAMKVHIAEEERKDISLHLSNQD